MSCKACSGFGDSSSSRVDQVRRLYNPVYSFTRPFGKLGADCNRKKCGRNASCSGSADTCSQPKGCSARYKSFWTKNCDIPCLRLYEDQPWFKDPIIKEQWQDFADQLVTPQNIGCHLAPGPDDYQYKCNKVRALMGPQVYCVWDLPEQDPCATTQYGVNRDWRRYNDDQRAAASEVTCGCSNDPVCKPPKSCEYPPYLGKKYGARYMAWAHPSSFMFPRSRPYNYQSLPKC